MGSQDTVYPMEEQEKNKYDVFLIYYCETYIRGIERGG